MYLDNHSVGMTIVLNIERHNSSWKCLNIYRRKYLRIYCVSCYVKHFELLLSLQWKTTMFYSNFMYIIILGLMWGITGRENIWGNIFLCKLCFWNFINISATLIIIIWKCAKRLFACQIPRSRFINKIDNRPFDYIFNDLCFT